MNLREGIQSLSDEVRKISELGPKRGSEILTELSSLLAALNVEVLERNFIYNQKRQELLKEHETAAKARIFGESTVEWKSWQEAVGYKFSVLEMIRAIKYFLRELAEEKKESIY